MSDVKQRLEELRVELRAERISLGELIELQGLADQIDPSDVELLEAAGVPEFPDEPNAERTIIIAVGGNDLPEVTGAPEGWTVILRDHDAGDDTVLVEGTLLGEGGTA